MNTQRYYAAITVNDFTLYKFTCDEFGIYACLEPVLGHEMAEDIVCWCAEAPEGAEYDTDRDDVSVSITFF